MELDRIPLWRGDNVSVKQLVEDFARYLYLPRLKDSFVILDAIRDGVNLLTWSQDSFGFADSFDETAGRYKGLRGGQMVTLTDIHTPGLVVKSDVASKQIDAERATPTLPGGVPPMPPSTGKPDGAPPANTKPTRFHGTAVMDATRVGRDAGKIAEEVIAHLAGLVGSEVKVTLEIEANIPSGAPDNVVRTVMENGRTLKFNSLGFEKE